VIGILFGLYAVEADVESLLKQAGRLPVGALAGGYGPDLAHPGYGVVRAVTPGSSAAKVGLVVGDLVRAEPAWSIFLTMRLHEQVPVTVVHAGQTRRVVMEAEPPAAPAPAAARAQMLATLTDFVAALFGLLILFRSGGRPSATLLGCVLAAFGLAWLQPQFLGSAPSVFIGFYILNYLFAAAGLYVGFVAFGMRFVWTTTGRAWRWQGHALAIYGLVMTFAAMTSLRERLTLNGSIAAGLIYAALVFLSSVVSFGYLLWGWRRCGPQDRRRYTLLLIAFSFIVLNQVIDSVIGNAGIDGAALQAYRTGPAGLISYALAGVVAPVLLAYAILRHRVLDLGFVLNRTLVYSVVSAILLGAFGLSEWAIDHLVKIEGRETNALIDAGIALGVFLTFHKVRDFVEHAIELLFFRSWQEKEAALRKSVAEAAFITRREPLVRAFAGALSRFADGAQCAIYLRSGDGDYRLADGAMAGAPKAIDPDDPALVTLRAEHKPPDLSQSLSALPADLACPMINRNEVTGLVLLAGKPAAAGYRPDEAELIGWATTQVGLDLHALEVEQLQAAVRKADTRIEELRLALARPAS
jgi:hypothetical protein